MKKGILKISAVFCCLCLVCGCGAVITEKSPEEGTSSQTENGLPEEGTQQEESVSEQESTVAPYTLRLGFAGDMNLDENWATTGYLNAQENGIYDCIDPALIEELNAFDIFMVNNEFTYSDRGTPTENKMYTFRAKPERIAVLEELGTDIVLLANNHVFDYGAEAFEDTLFTLEEAGISYVGAGRNLEEACRPHYFEYEGIRIAYVAATKAEKYKLTPEAGEDSPGVLRCYEEELFLRVIKEAAAEADYVVASVHFGTEYENMADDSQRELAYAMIDAGADAVIGSHAHVIQGMEFYKEKPIIYNLGNFWFNDKDLYSCVVELALLVEGDKVSLTNVKFLPCTQYDCYTRWEQEGDLRTEILEYAESISFGVDIDEEGIVTDCGQP